jgi:hypothetical protein
MTPREFPNGTDIALGNPRSRGRVHPKPTPGSDDGAPPAKVRTGKTCKNERVPPCDLANPGRATGNANESFREIAGCHFFYFFFWTPPSPPSSLPYRVYFFLDHSRILRVSRPAGPIRAFPGGPPVISPGFGSTPDLPPPDHRFPKPILVLYRDFREGVHTMFPIRTFPGGTP